MKVFLSFCLYLFTNIFVFSLANSSGCSIDKSLKLLNRQQVYRPAIKSVAQDVYVTYPKDSEPTGNNAIVDFCVIDHDPNLFGAKPVFAYSVEEDIGRQLKKATIILKGQHARGINSTVEFYGFN